MKKKETQEQVVARLAKAKTTRKGNYKILHKETVNIDGNAVEVVFKKVPMNWVLQVGKDYEYYSNFSSYLSGLLEWHLRVNLSIVSLGEIKSLIDTFKASQDRCGKYADDEISRLKDIIIDMGGDNAKM